MKDRNQQYFAISECESYLIKEREYNTEKEILPSENRIIEHLFRRRDELKKFYGDIFDNYSPMQWKRILSIVLYTAAFWNPDSAKNTRDAVSRLIEINKDIEKQCKSLSKLLETRSELSEKYGLHAYEKYHIVDLIDVASKNNGHYNSFLKKPLHELDCQFDLKYWPSLSEIVDEISVDAESTEIYPHDSITEANIRSSKNSQTDFYSAFFQALDEERIPKSKGTSGKFRISDESMSAIGNCALNLSDEVARDAPYIKQLRQRIRKIEIKNKVSIC